MYPTYVGVTGSNTCLSDFRYLISSTRDSLCRNTFVHKATGFFTNRFSFSAKSSRTSAARLHCYKKHRLYYYVNVCLHFLFARILFPLIISSNISSNNPFQLVPRFALIILLYAIKKKVFYQRGFSTGCRDVVDR